MKKILTLLGTITLIGTSTTSLVSCNTAPQYNEKQLKELKDKNNININGNILEWITPQEKPFKIADNKYYFVVWHGNKNDNWRIAKFKHSELKTGKIFDKYNNKYTLELREETSRPFYFTLYVLTKHSSYRALWNKDDGTYFKSVYRWNGSNEPNTLIIDPKTGQIKV